MIRTCLFAFAIASMPIAAAQAAPADTAAAVSAPGRPAEATALDAGRHPAEVLHFMGLKRGDRALDLYSASGYYAEIIGRAVGPTGSALGWTPTNFMDDEARQAQAAVHTRAANVSFISTPADAFALPAGAFDFAMINLNYHDTYYDNVRVHYHMDPQAFLAHLVRVDEARRNGRRDRPCRQSGRRNARRGAGACIASTRQRSAPISSAPASSSPANPTCCATRRTITASRSSTPAIRGHTDRAVMRFRRPS